MRMKKGNKNKGEEKRKHSFWKFGFRKAMERKKSWRNVLNRKLNSSSTLMCNKHDPAEMIEMNGESSISEELRDDEDYLDFSSRSDDKTLESLEHSQLLKQIDILSFESDDEIAGDCVDEDQEVFTSLSNILLPANSTQLAIFINYTLIHSISEPILFFIITELYKKGNLKEMKKWAYEIYSTFIAFKAPLEFLKLEIQKEGIINDIDMKLLQVEVFKPTNNATSSYDFEMLRLLREIFQKARIEAQRIISTQFDDFQAKRKAGLATMYGASIADLNSAKKNKSMQLKVIEKNLMPKLMMMVEEMQGQTENANRLALLSALSTVIHQMFHPSIDYFTSIDQFVLSGISSPLPELYVNGHFLVPKICYSSTYCDFCLKLLWGLSPQGYQCSCGIKVHVSCIDMLTGTCILNDNLEKDDETDLDESKDSSKLLRLVHSTLGSRRVEDYKRIKGNRPKSDPGLYNKPASDSSSDDGLNSENLWRSDLTAEIPKLSDIQKKRREIIMELFETERRHVKVLKTLNNIFLEPLKRSKALTAELADSLFPPSFLVIKDWHASFERMLKKEWHEQHGVLLEIGNCISIFEGAYGNILKENAANFCAGQQVALEALKAARVKNEGLQRGLIKAESHRSCRRLQLKDLMVSILQRLTKYPLLFERILKYAEGDDRNKINKAVDASKMILNYVNTTVRNIEELRTIHLKLDKSYFEKDAPAEFKHLNLMSYKLIASGYMILKKNAQPMRILLFDKILVLLHKFEERYALKPCEALKFPVMRMHNIIVRSNAVDSKSFFLICQDEANSQMVELIALNETEAQNWIRIINDAEENARNTISLKRRSSAESAQSMLRSDSQRVTVTKQSDLASITKTLQVQAKYAEEWILATQRKLAHTHSDHVDSCEVDNINVTVNTLNRLISQLSIKIAERDHERDLYLRENQRLREQNK